MNIRLENVSKFYYSSQSVTHALQKISLELDGVGLVAITGESGSGKSTLVSVISGMLPFEEGELYIDDKPMSECDDSDWEEYRKNKIGFVFQEYNLIEEYTVLDNVESAIVIRGMRTENIRSFAKDIIRKVGLEEHINQKASKLSSGQKQRLAIARALAKETDIIVADEPTGNLDSENGSKIMELFAKIAEEKMVIMVTHNYELAKDYVTRQIRIFDGKIVSDTVIKDTNGFHKTEEPTRTKSASNKNRIAWKYTVKNIVRQPFKAAIIAAFILATAMVSFVFMGQIISNLDDVYTKIYDDDVFKYENDKRIVVKKPDRSAITEEDFEFFSSINYVETVEMYDLCNDIRYANIPKEDYYETFYGDHLNMVMGSYNAIYVNLNEETPPKYMRSASCISKDDLKEGRLPENRNEIVMYIEGSLADAEEEKIYIINENVWGQESYENKFKIVGVLKEKTKQIYFSESFCDMITAAFKQGEVKLEGAWCAVARQYRYRDVFVPIINEDMKGQTISLSSHYYIPYAPCSGQAHANCERFSRENSIANLYASKLLKTGEIQKLEYENLNIGETTDDIQGMFMNVSEEFFYELYDYGSHQASLYIEHYAFTDKVIKALEDEGYDAISSYRVSCTETDSDKSDNRVRLLLVSIAVLVVMTILEVLIVSSFLKLRRKFYANLRFMGMELDIIKRMNFYEMNLYAILAVMITLVGAWIVDVKGILSWVSEFRIYMDFSHYLLYIIYNFVLTEVLVKIFNKYLSKKC